MLHSVRVVNNLNVAFIDNVKIDEVEYGRVEAGTPTEYITLASGQHFVTIGPDDVAIGDFTPGGYVKREWSLSIEGSLQAVTIDLNAEF